MLFQFMNEAAFSKTRFAANQGKVSVSFCGALTLAKQQLQFVIASSEWRKSRSWCDLETAARQACLPLRAEPQAPLADG